jgi:hypothetical protein
MLSKAGEWKEWVLCESRVWEFLPIQPTPGVWAAALFVPCSTRGMREPSRPRLRAHARIAGVSPLSRGLRFFVLTHHLGCGLSDASCDRDR